MRCFKVVTSLSKTEERLDVIYQVFFLFFLFFFFSFYDPYCDYPFLSTSLSIYYYSDIENYESRITKNKRAPLRKRGAAQKCRKDLL